MNEVRSTVKNYLTAHKDELSGFSKTDVDIVNELDKLFENPLLITEIIPTTFI